MKEIRSCIMCKKKKNKHDLMRIVAINGEAKLDINQNISSRGIYICDEISCLEKMHGARRLGKLVKIDITEEKLKKIIEEILGEKQVGKN